MPDYQVPLFYDDAYDALERAIAASGKTKKEIAAACYPGRSIETAKSLLSRALSPENNDVHLCICTILTIMRETRPDDFIHYLCDEFGFERPIRKERKQFEKTVKEGMKAIQDQFRSLAREISQMEKISHEK